MNSAGDASIPLLNLLRLASPALPIGGYAYSQGLEMACDSGIVVDETSLRDWISGMLRNSIGFLDVPVFMRLFSAQSDADSKTLDYWNEYVLASRETSEILLEDVQMGGALMRLLGGLDVKLPDIDRKRCSLLTAMAVACVHWKIDRQNGCTGVVWSWCENQVGIGIKLIPLGQTSGQRILSELIPVIPEIIENGSQVEDDYIGASCPGAVMASMAHEDQYSRLFRS